MTFFSVVILSKTLVGSSEAVENDRTFFACRSEGKRMNGTQVDVITRPSLTSCAVSCLENVVCVSFNWRLDNEACELCAESSEQLLDDAMFAHFSSSMCPVSYNPLCHTKSELFWEPRIAQ